LNNGNSLTGFNNAYDNLSYLHNRDTVLSLAYTIPLGNNLLLKRAVLSARTKLRQAQINLDQIKLQLENQVVSDIQNLAILKKSLERSNEAFVVSQENARNADAKFNEGLISAFELTQIENNLINARVQAFNSKIAYITGLANFDNSLGTTIDTWKIDIVNLEDSIIDQEEHFRDFERF